MCSVECHASLITEIQPLSVSLQSQYGLDSVGDYLPIRRKGDTNSMANWVMLRRLGYSCNLFIGFKDQVKTLNVLKIWNDLHNEDSTKYMIKHKFNDLRSIKSYVLILNMRLNNNAVPLDSKNAFSS